MRRPPRREAEPVTVATEVRCWRCGKKLAEEAGGVHVCPRCHARNAS
jgi:phage FluMu protein Com